MLKLELQICTKRKLQPFDYPLISDVMPHLSDGALCHHNFKEKSTAEILTWNVKNRSIPLQKHDFPGVIRFRCCGVVLTSKLALVQQNLSKKYKWAV